MTAAERTAGSSTPMAPVGDNLRPLKTVAAFHGNLAAIKAAHETTALQSNGSTSLSATRLRNSSGVFMLSACARRGCGGGCGCRRLLDQHGPAGKSIISGHVVDDIDLT